MKPNFEIYYDSFKKAGFKDYQSAASELRARVAAGKRKGFSEYVVLTTIKSTC